MVDGVKANCFILISKNASESYLYVAESVCCRCWLIARGFVFIARLVV